MTESHRFLIETPLPLRELSASARREKTIRHGHISTLHVWWARRPLVVARAAVLGALLTESAEVDEKFIAHLCRWDVFLRSQALYKYSTFIANLCQCEVHDGDPAGRSLVEQARRLIRRRFGSSPEDVGFVRWWRLLCSPVRWSHNTSGEGLDVSEKTPQVSFIPLAKSAATSQTNPVTTRPKSRSVSALPAVPSKNTSSGGRFIEAVHPLGRSPRCARADAESPIPESIARAPSRPPDFSKIPDRTAGSP